MAVQALSSSSQSPIDFAGLSCRTTILGDADGLQHVLLHDDVGRLQLVISGADIRQPAMLHIEAVWPNEHVRYRLRALECLNVLVAKGRFPARLFAPDAQGQRLCFVLQALDGSLAGAKHRDIAIALFGPERVSVDWADPGDHLRDRVRRAVRRGRELMNGGYRNFLS